MNEKNELNDIILNKGSATNSNKKIILAVATLGVILIIVVMLMNSLNSSGTDNLPQAVLPPEPKAQLASGIEEEPLFEDITVEEEASTDTDLDMITKKLKEESLQEVEEETIVQEPVVTHKRKTVTQTTPKVKTAARGNYFIQVGSFSKYKPNKKFIASITQLGYTYKYHKIGTLNKVLVGPFNSKKEANSAKRVLRSKVEPGAFLVKL